jgi:hypothetical protein
MPMKVLDTCVATRRHAVTARQEMVTKLAVIDAQKVRRVVMAHAVNAGLAPTVHHTRQDPVPINHIRPARRPENQEKKKATQNPMPPFDLSS